MKKKNNKKGFTLAELLIVVAIIAVLVAIAIPIFSSQLEKSREATDLANVRSAYATLVADYLTNTGAAAEKSIEVPVTQKEANWQSAGDNANYELQQMKDGAISTVNVPSKIDGTYKVTIAANGTITVN